MQGCKLLSHTYPHTLQDVLDYPKLKQPAGWHIHRKGISFEYLETQILTLAEILFVQSV